MRQINLLRWVLLLALTSMFATLGACQNDQRQPHRYLIPEGYVGWVRINYNVKDAPTIPIEDGYRLFMFPENGTIHTALEGQTGFATDEYYYYFPTGRQQLAGKVDNTMIWGRVAFGSKTVRRQQPDKYEEFFVGTKADYEQFGIKYKDSELDPIIGPIYKTTRESDK